MNTRHQLFIQSPHSKDVSDFFHIFNTPNILNVIYWEKYFDMIKNIEGDIVECGVGRGRSLLTILALESLFRTFDDYIPKGIHALDSFEGFPEPTAEDISPRKTQKGEWSQSPNGQFNYSISNLHQIIRNAGIQESLHDELILIKGFFDETVHQIAAPKIALLHLDSDLYLSIKTPLATLADKISIGGIVVLDDYLLHDANQESEPFPGARRAVNEFLQSRTDFEQRISVRGTPYLVRTTA
ncbi:Uncharacterised protein [uncultured Comamonas sp.]|nr:Uncharacterised protein [uncultured Comamonas sp.]